MTASLTTAFLFIVLLLTIVKSDDKASYLAYLLNKNALLSKDIGQVLAINSNLTLNLKAQSSPIYQEKVLSSAIRDQTQILIDAISHTFLSLNKKIGNCTDNSNSQMTPILNKIQSQLQSIEQTIDRQAPCQKNSIIKRNYRFYTTIVQGLQAQTNNQCTSSNIPFMNINNTKFVPNTQVSSPWVYGQITSQQFLNKKSEFINILNASVCPQATPFLDDANNCMGCFNNTIYEISSMKCIVCGNGTTFNKDSHACTVSSAINSNITNNLNFVGSAPSFDPQIETCPQDKPFFNGKSCISCSLPSYFSFTSNTCQSCPQGEVFQVKSSSCLTNSFFLSNLSGNLNYIGSPLNPLPYDNVQTCASDKPFSDGKQCLSCGGLQFFNFEKMSCQSCPELYHFDTNTHSCTSQTDIFINSNLISNRNFVGKVPIYNNLFKNCDQNTPFFNGSSCVSCPFPNYFDFGGLKCDSCNEGLTFNIIIQACQYIKQDFYTNLQVKNIYYNGNFQDIQNLINTKKDNSQDIKVCPQNTPYYNSRSNTCIECQGKEPLFDFKNNRCMNCPQGSSFQEQSHICLTHSLSATLERMIMNTS